MKPTSPNPVHDPLAERTPTLHRPNRWRPRATSLVAMVSVLSLAGCNTPPSIVQGPLSVPPVMQPTYLERTNPGSLFQPDAPVASLFSGQKLARQVGDKLKVDIAESFASQSKVATDHSRENAVASKGPGQGAKSVGGFFGELLDLNASAAGSDSFKGDGNTEQSSRFTGQIAVQVINVLPNGHLVIAGERAVAFNRGVTRMRFSGVVSPSDIRAGNLVASSDVVNARLETAGEGDISDAASRSWLQRVLTKTLTVW